MSFADTSIGGPRQEFPSTVWSNLLAARDPSHPEFRNRMDQLLRAYWKPVFAYVRIAWRKPVEDAKDLTQAFFTRLLEKPFVAGFQPERGTFRTYLKQALKYFLINAERDASVRKPDGPMLSLDATPDEMARLSPAAPTESPDEAYDRQWNRVLLDSAIGELEARLEKEGKSVYFKVFRAYLFSGDEPPTYTEVAAQFSLRDSDVRNYLHLCRTELRKLLRERIRDTVETDGDVDRELERFLNG